MKCNIRISVAEHLHNLSPYSLRSRIEVCAEAWHAILYLITPRQYPPRLWHAILYLITPWQYLELSAEAWHAFRSFIMIMPWQYLPRLGMLYDLLSRLGSIYRGLACFSISYHAFAVSAEAWHAILYLISYHAICRGLACISISYHDLPVGTHTTWQYLPRLGVLWQFLPRLGVLFDILSRLCSICQGLACYSISAGSTSQQPASIAAARVTRSGPPHSDGAGALLCLPQPGKREPASLTQ